MGFEPRTSICVLGLFEPASPCSPTWYCQIPPPTLAPSEVLNGNTNTDVLDVGEITNQDWEYSPERASSEKRQQIVVSVYLTMRFYLGPFFRYNSLLFSINELFELLWRNKRKWTVPLNSSFRFKTQEKEEKKINVSPAIFCFTKKTTQVKKQRKKKYAAIKTHELLFKTY